MKKPLKKFSRAALEAMRRHDWPGNVRELQNRIKRALVLAEGPAIGPAELELETSSEDLSIPQTLKEATDSFQREQVLKALQENQNNISKAAQALGISRPTLYDLISRFGL